MKKEYQVLNVKCQGCAKTLKSSLKDKFGEVEVNLEVYPRVITLDIEPIREEELRLSLKKMGYPLINDNLTGVEKITTTAKSYVSCAIGRV